jgi:hypothetical protein
MGMISRKPSRNASAVMTMNGTQSTGAGIMQKPIPKPIIAMPMARFR